MSVAHDMMLFLDRTNHCLVCKVPVDAYTRHKNLDDVVEVTGGRTVRSCLQQVLDVSLAGSSAIWLCNKCYSDLEQIQLYYNLVKHFRERFHNTVQLAPPGAVSGNLHHGAYGTQGYDSRDLQTQQQQYPNPSLLLNNAQQNADMLLNLASANNQSTGGTTSGSTQPFPKYEHHQPQQQQQISQQHQSQHPSAQRPAHQSPHQPSHPHLQTPVFPGKKPSDGDFVDNILDLPTIHEVHIKKEVEKIVAEAGSDDDTVEGDTVSTGDVGESAEGVESDDNEDAGTSRHRDDTKRRKKLPPADHRKPENLENKDSSDDRFKCTECDKSLKTETRLKRHMVAHLKAQQEKMESQAGSKCTICEQIFKTETRLKRHMLTHKRSGPFKCSVCNKGFTSEKRLKLHSLSHASDREAQQTSVSASDNSSESESTPEQITESADPVDVKPKSYNCRVCKKSFAEFRLLRVHRRSHTLMKYSEEDGRLQCPDCEEHFEDAEQLKEHLKQQLCDWPWKCHLCDAGFVDEAPLKRHLKTHANESRTTCPICHKRLSDSGYMKEHIRVHTGELPHECNFCKKRFNNPSNLKQHERIHTGEKPYKCGVCGMGFRQINQKKVHEVTHTGKAPHVCPTCGKGFFWPCSYKKHLQIHSDERPELCSICGKSFRNIPALHAHLRSHSDYRPHMCSYCGKGFKTSKHLSVHKRIHTGEKPFICDLCGRGFSQTTGLKFHLKSHNVTSR